MVARILANLMHIIGVLKEEKVASWSEEVGGEGKELFMGRLSSTGSGSSSVGRCLLAQTRWGPKHDKPQAYGHSIDE
jgi:hypothetical protein